MPNTNNQIILSGGGYTHLYAFQKSDVILEATIIFCRRFLAKYGDRTVDQMTQAARSCKQNIAEGSAASCTSKETEIKLTGVAKASLAELKEDYLDWLKQHNLTPWNLDDLRIAETRTLGRLHSDWTFWREHFEKYPAEEFCNRILTLIHQTDILLQRLMQAQEEEFRTTGGIRERMTNARVQYRRDDWIGVIRRRFNTASSLAELQKAYSEIVGEINSAYWQIVVRNHWETGTAGTAGTAGTTD